MGIDRDDDVLDLLRGIPSAHLGNVLSQVPRLPVMPGRDFGHFLNRLLPINDEGWMMDFFLFLPTLRRLLQLLSRVLHVHLCHDLAAQGLELPVKRRFGFPLDCRHSHRTHK